MTKGHNFIIMNDIVNDKGHNVALSMTFRTTLSFIIPFPLHEQNWYSDSFAKKNEIYVRQLLHQVQGKYYSISFVV